MPKSRKRHKKKPIQSPRQPLPSSIFLSKKLSLIPAIFRGIATHPLVLFVTFVLTVFAAYDQLLSDPEINVQTAQIFDPFLARFSLYNPTRIAMKNMRISCSADGNYNNSEIKNLVINQLLVTSIKPKETIEYVCPMNKTIAGFGDAKNASVHLTVNFETMGHKRSVTSEPFNWDDRSHQWIKGIIVNWIGVLAT